MQQRVSKPEIVVLGGDLEARCTEHADEIVRSVHPAHAVRDAREVQRCRVQAVGRRFVPLPIAEQLEHEQCAVVGQARARRARESSRFAPRRSNRETDSSKRYPRRPEAVAIRREHRQPKARCDRDAASRADARVPPRFARASPRASCEPRDRRPRMRAPTLRCCRRHRRCAAASARTPPAARLRTRHSSRTDRT